LDGRNESSTPITLSQLYLGFEEKQRYCYRMLFRVFIHFKSDLVKPQI
jgi:hypothetical protein